MSQYQKLSDIREQIAKYQDENKADENLALQLHALTMTGALHMPGYPNGSHDPSKAPIVVLSIAEGHADYAKYVAATLQQQGISADVDVRNEKLSTKINDHLNVPYLVVVGDFDRDNKMVSVRMPDSGSNYFTLDRFVSKMCEAHGCLAHAND